MPKEFKHISSLLPTAMNRKRSDDKKAATSSRAALVQEICDDMLSQNDFEKVLYQTGKFTVDEIREIYHTSKNWKKNPPALFWKLIREKREEIKNQLKDDS
ncbi:MAG: hypothetical protein OXU73_02125 [Candidatus Campbellbacteria bacterium]|nr:hypothetical protein [Candidatus Campbellbacteria bacterium]